MYSNFDYKQCPSIDCTECTFHLWVQLLILSPHTTDSDLLLSKMIFKLVLCKGKLTMVKNVVRKVYSTTIEYVFSLLGSADYKGL